MESDKEVILQIVKRQTGAFPQSTYRAHKTPSSYFLKLSQNQMWGSPNPDWIPCIQRKPNWKTTQPYF